MKTKEEIASEIEACKQTLKAACIGMDTAGKQRNEFAFETFKNDSDNMSQRIATLNWVLAESK